MDGPEKLEKKMQPLILLVALLFSLWAMVRGFKAAAATLVSPASIKASRSFVPRVDAARAAAAAAAIAEAAAPDTSQATAMAALVGSMVEEADTIPQDGANGTAAAVPTADGGAANAASSTVANASSS